MYDPYFELLEADARADDRLERADHQQTRRDRLDDFFPVLKSDARAVAAAGRRDPERKDRS